MKKYRKYRDVVTERFNENPQEAHAYLQVALEEFKRTGDSEQLILALHTVTLDDWDKQIMEDSESGKLDDFIESVLKSHKEGQTTKLSQGLKRSNY